MLGMNIHINSLDSILAKLSGMLKDGNVHHQSMQDLAHASCDAVRKRVHEEGQAADGSDIGHYSTTPLYINITAAVGGANLGQPVGKTGRPVFAGGKKKGQNHKTAYLQGGYAQYKQALGTGKVNLVLSGELSEQFGVIKVGEGFGLGWQRGDLTDRALALEAKYGKTIWGLTETEKQQAVDAAQNVMHHAIS